MWNKSHALFKMSSCFVVVSKQNHADFMAHQQQGSISRILSLGGKLYCCLVESGGMSLRKKFKSSEMDFDAICEVNFISYYCHFNFHNNLCYTK